MGSIKEVGNKFSAQIRKKNINLYETFQTLKDAELWIAYKEDLIDQIDAFEPKMENLILLGDAIELTYQNALERNIKDVNDFKFLIKCFNKFIDIPISNISSQELLEFFNESMNTPIQRGGSHTIKNTGVKKLPSIHTIFRRFT